jgi:hypothetical protein
MTRVVARITLHLSINDLANIRRFGSPATSGWNWVYPDSLPRNRADLCRHTDQLLYIVNYNLIGDKIEDLVLF